MPRETTDAIRVTRSIKRRLDVIRAQVTAEGARLPTYTEIIETWEAYSDPAVIVQALVEMLKHPSPDFIRQTIANIRSSHKER